MHHLCCLTRRKYRRPHPMLSQPSASLLEVARPTVPKQRHNLVPRIVGERVERKRHQLNEPQSCLLPTLPYRRQLPSVRRSMQPSRRIVLLRHQPPVSYPSRKRHLLEVQETGVSERSHRLYCFLFIFHKPIFESAVLCEVHFLRQQTKQ